MLTARISRDEFEQKYAERSGVTVEWLHSFTRKARPCTCGEDGCEGWQMLSDENWDAFTKFQAGVDPESREWD